VDELLSPGEHSVLFTAESVPSGVYMVQMSANTGVRGLSIVLAK